MLIDKIRIHVKAGKGGDGKVSFGRDKKPNGGDGGKGGDVILVGSENINDLGKLKDLKRFHASDGLIGGNEKSTGKSGEDLILKVPITTIILDEEGKEVGKITSKNEQLTLAKGGRGGLGNFNFRYGQRFTLDKTTPGEKGEVFIRTLELRLIADIIFIGFPNAGKSSMLNMLTNADVKTAPYPFTTLEPHQGVCEGMLLMDLPGLIEGSHGGKGLGTRFTRHTKYTKAVAHFISLESENLIEDYKKIRYELKEIDTNLFNKPEFLVLTKSDLFDKSYINKKIIEIQKLNLPYIVTSCYDFINLNEVIKFLKNQVKTQ